MLPLAVGVTVGVAVLIEVITVAIAVGCCIYLHRKSKKG